MRSYAYDVVVVGAGSGGYAAACTARNLGATVALADRGPLGGLCILRGCMPSKTLLATSDRVRLLREAPHVGLLASAPTVDFPAVMRRKERIIRRFADDRIEDIAAFPLYQGHARFRSSRELEVGDDAVLEAKSFIIAAGSIVASPTVPGLAEVGYIDSDAALSLERLPASLIVLGGGYIAAELGQFFARLDVSTTILIRASHLLSFEDADVGQTLTSAFVDEGIAVERGARLLRVERQGNCKAVHFVKNGEECSVAAHEILYALGRVPNVEGLGLEHAGVAFHAETGIMVGSDLRSNVPTIFAVGDVIGELQLVHAAIYQGEIAARNAVNGGAEQADYSLWKTHAVFTDPQVAVVGETEKSLRAGGIAYRAASYPFSDHGKAIAVDRTQGFVKILAAPEDGRILGASIVGPDASDLIHEMIVAMSYGATVQQFVKIPHLHPTLAEIWTYPAGEIAVHLQENADTV